MEDDIEKLIDEDFLKDTLTFISFYTMVYESMTDFVVSNIHDFLCNVSIENGKIHYSKTQAYKEEIEKRVVDEKGNKDITKASFLWLLDLEAIAKEDYSMFLKIKNVRNKFVHDMFKYVTEGITTEKIDCFEKMILLYKKINKCWFINVEYAIMEYELQGDVYEADIENGHNMVFDIMKDVIFNGQSKKYKEWFKAYKDGDKNEV